MFINMSNQPFSCNVSILSDTLGQNDIPTTTHQHKSAIVPDNKILSNNSIENTILEDKYIKNVTHDPWQQQTLKMTLSQHENILTSLVQRYFYKLESNTFVTTLRR